MNPFIRKKSDITYGDPLYDAYGISGDDHQIYDGTQTVFGKFKLGCNGDETYNNWKDNSWVSVKYIINEKKLVFDYVNDGKEAARYELNIKISNDL